MLKVQLPDGSVREYARPVRPIEIAAEIGAGLSASIRRAVIGAGRKLNAAGTDDRERNRPSVLIH